MRYSCIFFVSNPGAQLDVSRKLVNSIATSIEANSRSANRQADSWTLNHRVLRDVPPPTKQNSNDTPPHAHSYQHLLHLSYLNPDHAYTFLQHPAQNQFATQNGAAQPGQWAATAASASEIVQIPLKQSDSHYALLANIWTQLWSPQRTLEIPQGIIYKIRDYTIYIGELHAKRQGPQSANVLSPGVVVCITVPCGMGDDDFDTRLVPDEELDFDDVQFEVRELWKDLNKDVDFGKGDTREFMQIAQDFDGRKDQEREAVVRMWCEALRTRG